MIVCACRHAMTHLDVWYALGLNKGYATVAGSQASNYVSAHMRIKPHQRQMKMYTAWSIGLQRTKRQACTISDQHCLW